MYGQGRHKVEGVGCGVAGSAGKASTFSWKKSNTGRLKITASRQQDCFVRDGLVETKGLFVFTKIMDLETVRNIFVIIKKHLVLRCF